MSEELQPSQYRDILESLPNGIYVVNLDRKILFWNDGAERISGHLRQDVIGRCCPEAPLKHCDQNYVNLCELGCPLHETLKDGRAREANLYLCHKNGRHVPVHMRVAAIRNEHGSIIGAVESFDDGHKAAEAAAAAPSSGGPHRPYGLTGVSDAAGVRAFLEKCVATFAEQHTPFGVLSLALDDFAAFRKSHGGPAAERILQTVAESLSRNLPKQDLIGQWDEDRFVAVLVDCPPVMLVKVAERLRQVGNAATISWWGDRLSVPVSAGGTAARAEDTVESLLDRADRALQASRESGGLTIS
ncbi:MAG: diguanylate cyclase [Acidobacteriia bacterium]|nr:diguanylate cyclase [Terriglobia bacterium]